MSDMFEQVFAGLDDYYPGSKRKRREPPAPKVVDPLEWEHEAFAKMLPNGKVVAMYTTGSLAKALRRSVKTIRFWIDKGYLPTSPYRLPSTTSAKGVEYAGRRLYSKAMVQATVEIFTKAGIYETARVEWTVHRQLSDEIAEAWSKIRADEIKTN
jgi:hypothetical protein